MANQITLGVVEDKENFTFSLLSHFQLKNILGINAVDEILKNISVRVGKTPTTDTAIKQSSSEDSRTE